MSSKPTMESSSGTRTPLSCAARSAPMAIRSLQTNTAEGLFSVRRMACMAS
jgi:hypothetical protein